MAVGASQWLSQCLTALTRPRRPRAGLGTLALPPEIILMIATHLTNLSVISLALTCRTLYILCFPQRSYLNTAEKEELLLLLEKDIATLYFCHYCAKLHRWHTNWRNSEYPWFEDLPCKENLLHDFLRHPLTCEIPYHHARLVMNRHFYGPTHGLPLHKLEARGRLNPPFSRFTDSESLHARIVDDKLMVLSVSIMSHSQGDSNTLRSYVDTEGRRVCEHLIIAKAWSDRGPVQLPELAINKTTPHHFTPCEQSVRSCPLCPTDYCIDIWRDRKKGCFIRVSVYRQLGECRSPYDWNWRVMTSLDMVVKEPRREYLSEQRAGTVIDRWRKADGNDGKTQAEWVEIPRPDL